MKNLDAVKDAFGALNSFKRSRTLSEQHRKVGEYQDANYHELKMFKDIDRLELLLRTINKNERDMTDEYPRNDRRHVTSTSKADDAE